MAESVKREFIFGILHKIYTRNLANLPKFSISLYNFQKMYYNNNSENCVIAMRKNR